MDGIEAAELLSEREKSRPHPSIEVEQTLADGTQITAVWSLISDDLAKLVTVHYFDDE